ncbi:MAG: beta-galactosidase [Anaerolineae bacterium]|nr:beta-galactosidase [Thermoflexales bacterium]MDW8394648.1 beta-galactosidase [Anaerolineae bacterium]
MPIHLGAAWYPEHWPESRWAEDLQLMREVGLTVVRLGEFAWADLEPEEGRFNLDWLERAVALAAAHGLACVLGTPTAAPPAWLTQRYPDVLAVNPDGRPAVHGTRCHYDVTSERYLAFCRRIAEKLAERFGQNPHVIGWQIDNEYNTVSYSEGARSAFQAWLREQYGSLDALNAAWTTAYWSQRYTDWSQIPLPLTGAHGFNQPHSPALRLKWRQFVTEAYRRYQRNQVEVIRAHARPDQWITHNFMGFFDGYDHYTLCEDLDFASWDQYFPEGALDFERDAAGHDLTRGFKRRSFWLMETQPGTINWAAVNRAQERGETFAVAWTAIAHGADAVCYWQWRNALNGQEQYHGSLVAPDGKPRPIFAEIKRLGESLRQVGNLLDGAPVRAEVALLHSYEDRWALDFQRHHAQFDPLAYLRSLYAPLAQRNIAVDILSTRASLQGYRLVIAAPHLIDEAIAQSLHDHVASGGGLVLGVRSGMKTRDNALWTQRQPALLQDLAGVHVEEYFALDKPIPVHLAEIVSGSLLHGMGTATIWAEWLIPAQGTQVLAHYGASNGWLDNQAALTLRVHPSGGWVLTLGGWFDPTLQSALIGWAAERANVSPVMPIPLSVAHVMQRGDAYIVIAGRSGARISLPWRAYDHLSRAHVASLELPAWGVAVLTPRSD